MICNDVLLKEPDRQRIAAEMAAYEAKHGPVVTSPIVARLDVTAPDYDCERSKKGTAANTRHPIEKCLVMLAESRTMPNADVAKKHGISGGSLHGCLARARKHLEVNNG